jgi:rod shape determining protein RodA
VSPARTRGPISRALSFEIAWSRVAWHVLLMAGVLLSVGLMVLSAMEDADLRFQRPALDFDGHLHKVALALPFLFLGLWLRPRWLKRRALALYGGAILLLVLVHFVGQERNHARRWLALPGVGFDLQPSELAKVALVVALARVLERRRLRRPADWRAPAALALLPMALVSAQPDLGTALSLVPIAFGMFWMAGARGRALLWILAGGLAAFAAAYRFELVRDYQRERVDTWLESFAAEPLVAARNGPAYHVYQARVAIGNGGWFGTGLGRGVANEAAHLPERDCDSIFAAIAEEGGLLGAGALVGLYATFAAALLGMAGGVRDRFSRLAVGGIGLYFSAHLLIHAGVNLGLMPLTGLPLPLLSTGGSSLLSAMLALGLALGLEASRVPSLDEDAFRE